MSTISIGLRKLKGGEIEIQCMRLVEQVDDEEALLAPGHSPHSRPYISEADALQCLVLLNVKPEEVKAFFDALQKTPRGEWVSLGKHEITDQALTEAGFSAV